MKAEDVASGLEDMFRTRPNGSVSAVLGRQIADHSPTVMVVAAAPDFQIVYANRAARRAARDTAGELVGRRVRDALPFIDPAALVARNGARASAVADRSGEATVWWDLACVALEGATDPALVLITATDVTHHEIEKVRSQAAGDTLDALLDYIPQGISIARGPQVQVERISAQGTALIGRDADELTGRSALQQTDVWEVYRPGSDVPLSPADRPLARATRTGEVTLNETLLVRRRDGDLLTVVCNSGPIRDAHGRVTGAVMAWQDVGELQQAQAALRESEQRLRAVLLQIPAAIFIVEAPDGRMTFRSRRVDEVLGELDQDLAAAQATRRGWAVHADGSPYALSEYPSRRALFSGETVRGEPMLFSRADGRVVDLEMHAGPIHGETGEIIAAVGVALDVTERRLADARQAFLFRLQDTLRTLSEPAEILTAAATLLGRHLGAARIGYSEMQPDGETLLVTNGYSDGAPPVNGLFPLARFGPHHEQEMRQGRTLVYEDVQADDRGASAFGVTLGTRAHVSVPLIRDGGFVGSLYVTHVTPHTWSAADIALIEEVAARIWDAAERGRAEARLRESEERLRLALESTGLGFWEYDATTGKSVRSARHDAIFGYATPVADWSQDRFKAHIQEPDAALVEGGLRAALEHGNDWAVECRMIRTDGSQGWLQVQARPQFDADGRVVRLLGTVADISERKWAEETVIQTAAKFESFAQMIPSMVWTSLPDGQIDWFNARVSEYSGVPADAMKPDGWLPVHPDDVETAVRLWKTALESEQPFETEYRIRRHDGMFRWHLTRAIPIRGADGAIALWIGTSADIQDQKNAEQALADLNATLEEQVRARTAELREAEASLRQSQKLEAMGQLTGGVAHDFNNLLTPIVGALDMLQRRGVGGEREQRLILGAVQAAERAKTLVQRLLAFARRQPLQPSAVDIAKLVADMADLIASTSGPQIRVSIEAADDLPFARADPNQLEMALLNLSVNARDAMPSGGTLRISATRGEVHPNNALGLAPGAYVRLSVADTGSGMDEATLARAAEPFFSTKGVGKGTGLGLSMAHGLASQLGGALTIQSRLGLGTNIELWLPTTEDTPDSVVIRANPSPEPASAGLALLVDDEDLVRMSTAEMLGDLGYTVVEASSAEEALKRLRDGLRPDLLMTDHLMAGMNGTDLARLVRSEHAGVDVLIVSGYAESEGVAPDLARLTKPFRGDELADCLANLAARRG